MNDGAAATETRREVATLAILINTNATRAVRMPLGVNQSRAFLATVVLTCLVCALASQAASPVQGGGSISEHLGS